MAGTITVAAEAAAIAATKSARAATARAAVAARTIRRRAAASAQFVFRLQPFDGVHLDALLGVAFDALSNCASRFDANEMAIPV